ncbi:hypothetical protein JCM3765_003686 [Sporobolomyces pararoseus]
MAQIEDDFAAYTTIGDRVTSAPSTSTPKPTSSTQGPKFGVPSKLEPFTLLAKSARGAGAANLISQAVSAPGVFVFSELLQIQSIKELATNEQHVKQYKLLELFAYGTWNDYKAARIEYPTLTLEQEFKLKQLTILSLASQTRTLPYSTLLSTLELSSVPELEDLLIESIYSNIFSGRLDQKSQQFEILSSLGRDVKPITTTTFTSEMDLEEEEEEGSTPSVGGEAPSISSLLNSLTNWEKKIENLLKSLDQILLTLNSNSINQSNKSLQHEQKVWEIVNQIAGTKAAGGGPKGSISSSKGKDKDKDSSSEGWTSVAGGTSTSASATAAEGGEGGGGGGEMDLDNPSTSGTGTTRSAMSPGNGLGQRHRKRGRV